MFDPLPDGASTGDFPTSEHRHGTYYFPSFWAVSSSKPKTEPIEIKVNHRRCIKSQDLTNDQTSDNRYPQRPPELRSIPAGDDQRQRTKARRERGHHDRAKPHQAGPTNC